MSTLLLVLYCDQFQLYISIHSGDTKVNTQTPGQPKNVNVSGTYQWHKKIAASAVCLWRVATRDSNVQNN